MDGPNFGLLQPAMPKNQIVANLPLGGGGSGGGDDGIGGLLSGLTDMIGAFKKMGGGGTDQVGGINQQGPQGGYVQQQAQGQQLDTRPRMEQFVAPSITGGNQPIGQPTSLPAQSNQFVAPTLNSNNVPSQTPQNNNLQQASSVMGPIPDTLKTSPAFQSANQAWQNASKQGITKSPYMTVVDFSKPATSKRLWVVNNQTGQVAMNTYVTQGAPGFSNTPGSHQSSLGTYVTGSTYIGQHGPSLRVQGIDKGINDNAAARDITVHPAEYAATGGRSWGCFGLPPQDAQKFAQLTAGGSVIHAWAPGSMASSDKHDNFLTNPSQAGQILSNPNNNPFRPPKSNTMTSESSDSLSPEAIVRAAKAQYPNNPALAQLTASQAILESGIGSDEGPSKLARDHNNLFGIKGHGTAGSVNMGTNEYSHGRMGRTSAGFASNHTIQDSFTQHDNLLQHGIKANPALYHKVLSSPDFDSAASEIYKAGYATDPNYTNELKRVHKRYVQQYF